MAKHAPLMSMCSYHRAYNAYYLVLRYMGIEFHNSIQQYIHVHRARDDLQHFRHYSVATVFFLCSICT